MTIADIQSRITLYTNASTTQFVAADRLIAVNKAYNDIQTMILQSVDGWDYDDTSNDDFPILTTDLVASQQDYSLPSTSLKVKRLEVNYGDGWKKATPFDVNQTGEATDDSSIADNFSQDKPFYDLDSGSLLLYPIPDAAGTAMLKIWINRSVTEFTATDVSTGTKVPGFDKQFHDMIALSASMDWAIAKGKSNIQSLKSQLAEYEQRLKQYYGDKQTDSSYQLNSAYNEADYE